jgi:hypothetical protein
VRIRSLCGLWGVLGLVPLQVDRCNSVLLAGRLVFSLCSTHSACRHVIVPQSIARSIPKNRLLTETEWRNLGVQQSRGWVHYLIHKPGRSAFALVAFSACSPWIRAAYSLVSTTASKRRRGPGPGPRACGAITRDGRECFGVVVVGCRWGCLPLPSPLRLPPASLESK